MKIYSSVPCFLLTIISASIGVFFATPALSQEYDTLSNWDNINQNWEYSFPGHQIVFNPNPDPVNSSANCQEFISTSASYDYMLFWLDEPMNLDQYPIFRIKVYTPTNGGKLTLKFENENNSIAQEIDKDVNGGSWVDVEFDFSGLYYDNFVKLVIFPDFENTIPGRQWYIDDVIRQLPDLGDFESELPIFSINTFGSSIPNEPKIPAQMGIIDNGPGQINHLTDPFNHYSGNIGIEIRGSSTQMFPKKSYGFETRDENGQNQNESLLGMPQENDWILYAPYTDKSMLRNILSFAMGRKMSTYCSRMAFCELFINNDYKGVYILMEKIKKDNNRVDIATLNPEEITGDDVTGGYILSVDKTDWGFQNGYHGWVSNPSPSYPNAVDNIFQYIYPKAADIVSQQKNYIQNHILEIENTLISSDFANPVSGYHQYLDLVSFADFMILSEIAKEVDKYRYSTFFYKEKDSDGGKLFAGPAWDFNLGYGNVDYWQPGIVSTGYVYTLVNTTSESRMFWWKRLMSDPYFANLAKTRYQWLRLHAITNEFLNNTIDSSINVLGDAISRNYERWPILGTYVWPNHNWQGNDYSDEVNYVKNFLFLRLGWLDYNFPGKVLNPWLSISPETNAIKVQLNNDYFDKTRTDITDFQLNDAMGGLNITSVEYINPGICMLNLSGDASNQTQLSVTVDEDAFNTFDDLTSNKLGTAGTIEFNEQTLIKIMENKGEIIIYCTKPEILGNQVEITNITGKLLHTFSIEKNERISISHQLPSGIYIVKLLVRNQQYSHKIAVIH